MASQWSGTLPRPGGQRGSRGPSCRPAWAMLAQGGIWQGAAARPVLPCSAWGCQGTAPSARLACHISCTRLQPGSGQPGTVTCPGPGRASRSGRWAVPRAVGGRGHGRVSVRPSATHRAGCRAGHRAGLIPAHQAIVVPKAAASGLSAHVRGTRLRGAGPPRSLTAAAGSPAGRHGDPQPRTPPCCSRGSVLPAAAAWPMAWASSQGSGGAGGQSQII